MYNNAVVN